MDKSLPYEEPMLELLCSKCGQKFYWGAIYGGVSCMTKCPSCNVRGDEHFSILKRITDGTKAEN